MLTAAGAHAGVLKGLPCLFGVTTGMGLMMLLVPLGLGSLVLKHPLVLKTLNWSGAAFLLWLSWKIATSSSRIESMAERNPVGYLGAAVFQWVNPKSWLVSASAATPGLPDRADGRPQRSRLRAIVAASRRAPSGEKCPSLGRKAGPLRNSVVSTKLAP